MAPPRQGIGQHHGSIGLALQDQQRIAVDRTAETAPPRAAFTSVRKVGARGLARRDATAHTVAMATAFVPCAAAVCLAALAVLIGASVLAAGHEAIGDGVLRLLRDPWGLATLLDLAVGLGLAAAWMCAVEARPRRLWLWLPLLACLGNIATAIFLLARLRRAGNLRSWLTERL